MKAGKRLQSGEAGWGYLLVAPTILGLLILNIYPLIQTIQMSFSETMFIGTWEWVGLANYKKLFTNAAVWQTSVNTLYFVLLSVPTGIFLAMVLANMLNAKIRGRGLYRAIFFLPMVVAPTAIAMVWKWLYNAEYGLINTILGGLNLPSTTNWISDSNLALPACALVAVWSSVGYDLILLMAGLQNISPAYYEAADIDGASSFAKFFRITIPMVSPTLFFVVVLRLMTALRQFDLVYMMVTDTNPAFKKTQTLMYMFYRESFVAGNKGFASAVVLWTFVLISVFTVIQFIGQKYWVNYDS